MKPIKRQKN